MPHRVQHCAQRKMSRGCGWNSHGGRRGPDEGGKDDGASANVRKVAFASEGPFRCTHCGFDRPTSLFTNATERAMVDERRWGAAAVRVMRQPRGRRVGKGLRSGGRAGNVATVRVMRRSRGERGSARATRQRAAVARRYAGATARRRSREHGALLLLSRGYGQGEGRGSKCSFLRRVMLRHATGMFPMKHSQ